MKENINLRDKRLAKKQDKNPITSIVLVAIAFLFYGGVFFLNSLVVKDIQAVEKEKSKIEQSLESKDFKEAYNFGADLIDLNSLTAGKSLLEQTGNIIKISEKTLPEAFFSTLTLKTEDGVSTYDAGVLALDYNILAKQLNYYQEIVGIKNLFLKRLNREDKEDAYFSGEIIFDLNDNSDENQKSQEKELVPEKNF